MSKLTRDKVKGHGLYFLLASFMNVDPKIMGIRSFFESLDYFSDDDDVDNDVFDNLWSSPEERKKAIEEYCKKVHGE